jgi:hypothetical protein
VVRRLKDDRGREDRRIVPAFASLRYAKAVDEFLGRSKWCLVQLLDTVDQTEAFSEFSVERVGIITLDIKPAAFRAFS